MKNEREELMLVIAEATVPQAEPVLDIDDEGAIVLDAKKLADAILAAGYSKGTAVAQGLGETEWGVGWGDEIRPVLDKTRAKFIAREMGTDLYGRSPMGQWVKVNCG